MNTTQAIFHRRSVRTFDGRALLPDDAQRISDYAENADNPYNIPITWRLLSAAGDKLSSPVIVGADTYIAGKLVPEPHAEEAFGYSFEKILLFAESLSIGSTWIAGTMDRPAFERAMELQGGEIMPCVSPLGYPAAKMSLRESMMRKGVRADTRIDFSELFFDGGFDTPLLPERAGKLQDILELVRRAPSAVNKQPWRAVVCGDAVHFYEKRSRGYVNESGWDLQKIDLGIALCHFDLGARECGVEAEFAVSDPGLPLAEDTAYIASFRVSVK